MTTSIPDLRTYLGKATHNALSKVDRLDPDYLLSENVDVLIAQLKAEYAPDPIKINWGDVTRSNVTEISIREPDPWSPYESVDRPGSSVSFKFPYTGTIAMLSYPASTSFVGYRKDWGVDNGCVTFAVRGTNLTSEVVAGQINDLKDKLDKLVAWANGDLYEYLPNFEQTIRQRIESRKERLLRDRHLEATLEIPVKETGTSRPPVPAKRRQISLSERSRASASEFVPEPVLEEAIYQDILKQIAGWTATIERTPSTWHLLGEEGLRDLLLGTLNTYWEGQAGGELFNGAGKTDILIRHADRNAFIGELKIWTGKQSALNALDQLLGYMVWRDSKAALIMFIKGQNPADLISRLHSAVESHKNYVLTKPGGDPVKMAEYTLAADEEGRRVSVAVIPVIIGPVG